MDHEGSYCDEMSMTKETRMVPPARKYRIRLIGILLEQDTWEPRLSLFREIPDVIWAYDFMENSHPDMPTNVNVLVVIETDKVVHDVENGFDVDIESVVVTGYHHDHESETVMKGVRQDGQANVSPLCAECPAETGSDEESDDAGKVHRV